MRFEIAHTIRYTYSGPVFLEPQTIRLRPRSDATQKLIQHTLKLDPEPSGAVENIGFEGNNSTSVWFCGKHSHFTLTATSSVETLRQNAFDYIITDAGAARIPAVYTNHFPPSLQLYREPRERSESLEHFAQEIRESSDGETLPFLAQLTARLYEEFEFMHREEGKPFEPEETLKRKRGACRDLSVLFNEICRTVGLATRFVSGYQSGDPDMDDRELHAWSEVFLPGAGWRGYDPTLGLAVTDHHVALVAGLNPEHAAPTNGAFRGTGVTSEMTFEVALKVGAPVDGGI